MVSYHPIFPDHQIHVVDGWNPASPEFFLNLRKHRINRLPTESTDAGFLLWTMNVIINHYDPSNATHLVPLLHLLAPFPLRFESLVPSTAWHPGGLWTTWFAPWHNKYPGICWIEYSIPSHLLGMVFAHRYNIWLDLLWYSILAECHPKRLIGAILHFGLRTNCLQAS